MNSEDIHKSYAELFLTIKKPQVVPLVRAFPIAGAVQEATFYINREEGQQPDYRAPNGRGDHSRISGSERKWFKGQKFDVVTVAAPIVGKDWQVTGMAPDEDLPRC